jgi:glycosyltransferase involved in cell wall biosynthesis
MPASRGASLDNEGYPLKRVVYIYPYAFHYRVPFHERVRVLLTAQGIAYDVIYSSDPKLRAARGDLAAPEWAVDVKCTYLSVAGAELRYQHAFLKALRYDLIVLQQENGLLLNYPLQLIAPLLGRRAAFFGHGRNFQSSRPGGWKERFKRLWINRVFWWFAYTGASAAVVRGAGFPADRITIFNNALDTSTQQSELASIGEEEKAELRRRLLGGSSNVGIYIGALYPLKRIDFVIEAAKRVREAVPDFQLIILGGGEQADLARAAAAACDWIHYMGPKFGAEKALLASVSRVLLMPGVVGLAVLDSFGYGLPMVTTEYPYHSPEIDYLQHGHNGLIVGAAGGAQAYADAVVQTLRDDALRQTLIAGARQALTHYTIDAMAQRFADGVLAALARSSR